MIRQKTELYNEKRYGKPWIAKVDFSDPKGKYDFGIWTGNHLDGGAGILSIETESGDIIATGQKDYRKPRNSFGTFFVVLVNELKEIGDKGQAYQYFLDSQKSDFNEEKLVEERDKLLLRVAEIDKILQDNSY